MEARKNTALVVGLGIVALLGVVFASYSLGRGEGEKRHGGNDQKMMEKRDGKNLQKKSAEGNMQDHSAMTMDDMMKGLEGLKGDDFDKAFIEMMIVHHQGAVDMAKLIPENAQHDELKKLGADIIVAQEKEIMMMKEWQKSWGYDQMSDSMTDMDHNSMAH